MKTVDCLEINKIKNTLEVVGITDGKREVLKQFTKIDKVLYGEDLNIKNNILSIYDYNDDELSITRVAKFKKLKSNLTFRLTHDSESTYKYVDVEYSAKAGHVQVYLIKKIDFDTSLKFEA
jgi:hypothetical protein